MNRNYDYKLHFGDVPVGTEAIQYFEIKNAAKYPNWSIVQQEDFIHTLNTFSLKRKVSKSHNVEKHELVFYFRPYRPFLLNVNYYIIKNAGEKDIILKVTGYSVGISVVATVKYLNFYRLQGESKTQAIFELHNNSISKAMFQFDINNNHSLFVITPAFGVIPAGKYVYITVTFKTEKIGVFFIDQVILINFHKPIYVELLGVNSPKSTDHKLKELRGHCSKTSLESGFATYLNEAFGSITPICNITPQFISFLLTKPSVISELINYTDKCLEVEWENDELVSIKPERFHVRPNERCYFSVEFLGKVPELLYGGLVHGRAFINGGIEDQEAPETQILPISMRFISSTFYYTKNWTPAIELHSHNVMMPPCLQNDFVYSTFYIKRLGSYPVTFELSPPSKQPNFFVKPLNGIIKGDFQIFVVKFNPGEANEVNFQETWKIRLNQTSNVYTSVVFKAYVQNPKVLIGENNQIDFGIVFPGCKKYLSVSLTNQTQNKIEYLFPKNKWFSVTPSSGSVDSYGLVYLTWVYTADFDVEHETILQYEMRILQGEVLSGAPYTGEVKLLAKFAYGRFCSSPTKHNFETVTCGSPTSTKFTLYNFSKVKLHFLLTCHEHYGDSDHQTVFLTPEKGSVDPGEHVIVDLMVLTYCRGLSTYCIEYHLRESEESNILVKKKGLTFTTNGVIFRIDYYSFYPTLKFIEIGRNVAGPLYAKINVWEYCNMDKLNNLMRLLKINETVSYNIRLPEAEAKLDIVKVITFIVKNVTPEDTTCCLVRKKICSCELKEVKNASSFRKFNYEDCPHRKILTITTNCDVIKAYQTMLFKIEINYLIYGASDVCYLMQLSHNRTVELYFKIIGLQPNELSTYAHGFTLKMKSVFIGERHPDLQNYWFLNNTRKVSHYQLDLDPIINYNRHWGHNVLTCINPGGFVPPKSYYCIQFLYEPIAVGHFTIDLPFDFGEKKETLQRTALPFYASPLEHIFFSEIGRETVKLHDLYVNLSMEHIVIRSIPTHCSTKKIFVIKNIAASKTTVAFNFDGFYQENKIKAYIIPARGILKPGEACALVLHVFSGGISSTMRLSLACHLVDYDMLKRYINSMAEYHDQTDQRGYLFYIGPGGEMTYPEVPTVKITRGPRVFHRTISITCNIVCHTDIDTKITIHNQLKQTPFKVISLYSPGKIKKYLIKRKRIQVERPIHPFEPDEDQKRKQEKKKLFMTKCTRVCCSKFSSNEYITLHTVLSCLLHDFITSKKFKHFIQIITKNSEDELRPYSDMKTEYLTPEEETTQVESVVNKIPSFLLAQTLQSLLADCVLRHFKFGEYPYDFDFKEEDLFPKRHASDAKNLYTEKFSFLLDYM